MEKVVKERWQDCWFEKGDFNIIPKRELKRFISNKYQYGYTIYKLLFFNIIVPHEKQLFS